MTRITAPGLPPFPRLYFDSNLCRAQVSARHATWRSVERAAALTTLLSVGIRILLGYWLWVGSAYLNPLVMIVIVVAILSPLVSNCLRGSLQPFLARQVFPTRTTLWVTAQAIAVRSHLYAAPVLVWRHWNNYPIGVRFIVERNARAAAYAETFSYKERQAKKHLDEAAELVMVMTTLRDEIQAATSGEGGTSRAIPLGDLTHQDGAKFTMVFAMALALTAPGANPSATQPSRGVDIEGPTR
jgi:hypothetical protein